MPRQLIIQHGRRRAFFACAVGIAAFGLLRLDPLAGAQEPSPPDFRETILKKTAADRLLAEIGPDLPIDSRVARLIDRLVLRDRDQVQAAVTALDSLGRPAVQAIIRRIDDLRPMPIGSVAFENRSVNAFEAVRQLGVARVVDTLNLVLEDITGERIGTIEVDSGPKGVNEGPNLVPQRRAVVDGWRAYLARRGATPPVPGKSLTSVDGR